MPTETGGLQERASVFICTDNIYNLQPQALQTALPYQLNRHAVLQYDHLVFASCPPHAGPAISPHHILLQVISTLPASCPTLWPRGPHPILLQFIST